MVAAVEMGYGHLRAAHALSEVWNVPVTRADRAPFAGPGERPIWNLARRFYEGLSRGSQGRWRGPLVRPLLDAVTRIGPPGGSGDPTRPTIPARHLQMLVERGFGHGVVAAAREAGRPLVTTFFVPALAAQHLAYRDTWCVVTDTDASRAWVPVTAAETAVTFLVPCREVADRLRQYGVPEGRIVETGFPLPPELLGGPELPALRHNLGARLRRLDPGGTFVEPHRREIEGHLGPLPEGASAPPLLTYAVGGAGAQAGIARRIVRALRPALDAGRLRLCLVAGTHARLAERFAEWVADAGLRDVGAGAPVEILVEGDSDAYFRSFHRILARTDALWTKPSEMTFFAALGLPLLLAPPVGAQERANRRWAERAGVVPPLAGPVLSPDDGPALAAAAWAGFRRLPQRGTERIVELVDGAAGVSSETPGAPSCRAPSSLSAWRP